MAILTTLFTGNDLLAFRFLLASGGCVAAGLGVWALTALCRRYLPGIAAQRSVWLLGQCTVAVAFLLILLPQTERLRLLPPIEIDGGPTTRATAAPTAGAATATGPNTASTEHSANRSYLAYGAQAWLLIYLLGLGYAIARLAKTQRSLHQLATAGHKATTHNVDVIEVDAPISPMLFGLRRPRLLLPQHLRDFDAAQRQMIVEHELTHLRRRDLHWAGAGVLLQTLFWFNPFMRLLRARLSWAQELGCDRDVLQGRPQAQRKIYAAALVAQLKLQHAPPGAALAFGGVSANTVGGRIALIRNPGAAPRGPWTRIATTGGLLGVLAVSLALQPTLASHAGAPIATLACTMLADAATGKRLLHRGDCDERITPASTFNIAVSLMGYDSGILIDEHAPLLPYKPEYASWNPDWRVDTDPSSWLRSSTTWYAQQVTSRLGTTQFQQYVKGFNYGNQDLSGDAGKHNGLTMSWIASSLKISPAEQIDFLRNIVNRRLPLSPRAYDMTARILQPQTLDNGWTIYGKTGTASPVLADGRDDDQHQYGWYVGWATKGTRTIVFANMALDRKQEIFAGGRVRQAFLHDIATQLDTL